MVDARVLALAEEGKSLLERYLTSQDLSFLELAEQRLAEAVSRDPHSDYAHFTRGVVLEYLGDHDGAIDIFQHLLREHPHYSPQEVTYNLATSYLCTYREEGYSRARELFTRLAEPVNPPAMRALAHASLATVSAREMPSLIRRPEQIARLHELVVEHCKGAEELSAGGKAADWRLKETHWLIPNALGYADLYSGYSAFVCYGDRSEAERALDRAEGEFAAALRVSPGNLDVLSNLGTLLLYRWRILVDHDDELLRRSREIWTRVVKGRPKTNFGYYRLGQVERRLVRFEHAIVALRQALDAPFSEIPGEVILAELERAESADPTD